MLSAADMFEHRPSSGLAHKWLFEQQTSSCYAARPKQIEVSLPDEHLLTCVETGCYLVLLRNGISTANLSMVLQQIKVSLPVEQLLQPCGQLLLLQLL